MFSVGSPVEVHTTAGWLPAEVVDVRPDPVRPAMSLYHVNVPALSHGVPNPRPEGWVPGAGIAVLAVPAACLRPLADPGEADAPHVVTSTPARA